MDFNLFFYYPAVTLPFFGKTGDMGGHVIREGIETGNAVTIPFEGGGQNDCSTDKKL